MVMETAKHLDEEVEKNYYYTLATKRRCVENVRVSAEHFLSRYYYSRLYAPYRIYIYGGHGTVLRGSVVVRRPC